MNPDHEISKRKYGTLFKSVAEALYEHDPVGLKDANNSNEYDPEAGTIIPRLRGASTVEDVRTIVHEEFSHWFGSGNAGPKSHYSEVSAAIWKAWLAFKAADN